MNDVSDGYTLVVCEKPDAARKVADALSGGMAVGSTVEGVTVFRFERDDGDYAICAAQGHVYSVSDPLAERLVYPVFDVEWYDRGLIEKKATGSGRRIAAIKKLAGGATKFVNACDYDVEGETIGFNILRYACGEKEVAAKRAVFSTLTKEELVAAFSAAKVQESHGLATAGRARHIVDFIWGVNLSRALSQSAAVVGLRYRTVSMGRVQGPTLNFVVEREREIQEHVPKPFWVIRCTFEKGGKHIVAAYSKERLDKKSDAERVEKECARKEGVVTKVVEKSFEVAPPPPFNVGDLQKEAYRLFGYSPSRTLQVAERLYLDALISYPRTGSQKLPVSIDCRKIISGLASTKEYSGLAATLLRGDLRLVQGSKDDPAHPAIHPTGERQRGPLDGQEGRVFDLVVRRFLSTFAPPAKKEGVSVSISVGRHSFKLGGRRTVYPGWLEYYAPYGGGADVEAPSIREGDRLSVLVVDVEEKFDQRPPRYNQSSLLEKMESEGIGTKATRADVIATLVDRGYMGGESLSATDLGFSVAETMKRYAPEIVTTGLTKSVEEKLEAIEGGEGGEKELVRNAVRSISSQLINLYQNEAEVGREIDSAATAAASSKRELGACPVCKSGRLIVIRSKKSGKRFVGCTNYASGCRASAPLPQRGTLKPTTKPCARCSWPVVYVIAGRPPWKLCVNLNCPSKEGKKHEVPAV
ncbi:MAG: DNA topoisomerase I [Nitrososphaerota archaeon]|nr:DNA topoisomerase I [Nitrososphaerota archaeon]